mmetsp:Transcript_10960/g.20842  ORF Transcript_10960/g.20842 Transcript_10960/m.20842 type:complete len:84 (+) Transcript_10960:1131-1382(+)
MLAWMRVAPWPLHHGWNTSNGTENLCNAHLVSADGMLCNDWEGRDAIVVVCPPVHLCNKIFSATSLLSSACHPYDTQWHNIMI